jgi:hypothetical protein
MALLQNITLRSQYPLRENGGTTGFERSSVGRLERQMNRFAGEGGLSVLAATPYGYLSPSALAWPKSTGGIGSRGNVYGAGSATAGNLAGGVSRTSAMTGSGSITPAPTAQMLLWAIGALTGGGTLTGTGVPVAVAVAALAGSGTVTGATLLARANAVAALVGSGTISDAAADAIATAAIVAALTGSGSVTDANLNALAEALAALSGAGAITDAAGINTRQGAAALTGGGTVTAAAANALGHLTSLLAGAGSAAVVVKALGELEASILSYGALTPEGIRDSVWNAASAAYNASGTMGQKMNSAAAAGDPWTTELPGAYAPGSAGYILSIIAADATLLRKMEAGRWKIVNNQMIFYDEDGVTPFKTFDLTDTNGDPSMTSVFERVPV